MAKKSKKIDDFGDDEDEDDDTNLLCIASGVKESILSCPVDIRRELAGHIVPIGGGWMLDGTDRALVDALDKFSSIDKTVSLLSLSNPEIRKSTLLEVKGIWYSTATLTLLLISEYWSTDETTSNELFQLLYSP